MFYRSREVGESFGRFIGHRGVTRQSENDR
ncbi:MAG: hypothetical protein K0R75_2433 [Paenibacillaceae bacterium]|jgi:hypothetical protein|nr:hypothetical protein [Paenibacillaceae bacterium]